MTKRIDRAGRKYGRWVALEFSGRGGATALWKCRCECGTIRIVNGNNLERGLTTSCGCLHSEWLKANRTTHGKSTHPLYATWNRMRHRCNSHNSRDYRWYGGRGIKVCDRWKDFGLFLSDMETGWKKGLSIERINVNGNYEPSNCRWATQAEQVCNTRRSVIIDTPWGKMNAAYAADKVGINRSVFMARLHRGWPPERLFSKERFGRSKI